MADRDEDAWFAPKRYGFGAGLPIAWQGWALILGYLLAVGGAAALLLPRNRLAWIVVLAALSAALIAIAVRHTRGGWRWRWGEPD
ncbi:MAG TPA: hypothetical protein VFT56_02245 [Sphingomonas sp.]|nr:hypothetical protein [Sphingomonas sp.]